MSPEPIDRLLRRVRGHQAGLMLDTNVLLLHLAVLSAREGALAWKPTRNFIREHVVLLEGLVSAAHRIVTTPHILTEATNLAAQGGPEQLRDKVLYQLRHFAITTLERHVEAKRVAQDPEFSRLGLADLAQAFLGVRSRPLILTIDAPLFAELEKRRVPAINLNHYVFPL